MLRTTHRTMILLAMLPVGAAGCQGLAETTPVTVTGAFTGLVRAEWRVDGRNMVLVEPFTYRDAASVEWTAPRGTITDGASIPPVFWSLIGGPYEGVYRDAAVLHDYYCCVKQRPWRAVDRMFYEAMLTRGEALWRAKLMYFAVYHFGPKWPEPLALAGFTEGDAAAAAEYLRSNPDTTLEEIEQWTPARLRTLVPNLAPDRVNALGLVQDRVIPRVVKNGPCVTAPSH